MIRLTKYTIQLIGGLLLALLTAGCVADRNASDCITEGEEVELEFSLQVPALETSLRQLSEPQEKQVDKMRILVFNTQDDSGQTLSESAETFAYEAKYKNISQIDGTTLIRCSLKASSKPMRIVCIANHEFDTSILVEGKTKQAILEDTRMVKQFTKSGWQTEGSQLIPIPMWGESDAQPVSRKTKFNDCTANANGVIHLVRALARVDVGINFTQDETTQGGLKFKIKSVRVYRYAQSMYVTGTQSTTYHQTPNGREPLPHTPKGMTAADDTKPLEFTANAGVDSYVRNIYIPEISNDGKNRDQRTCLVIGGYYDGSKTETYYRVDFITCETKSPKDVITKQLDILRNHRYRFNITKIEGPGTDTPGEALKTEPVNIAYDVIVWDEAKIDKIMYDGQYYLSVSKDKFHFGKDAASENITIRTNWPDGYKIVDENGAEWAKSEQDATGKKWVYFTANDDQKLVDKDMTTTLNVLDNKTTADREIPYENEKLFVQAGRIKWPLKVTQSYKTEIDITLYEQDKTTGKLSAEPISHLQIEEGNANAKLVAVRYTKGARLERLPLTAHEQYIWERMDDDSEPGKALFRVTMIDGTADKKVDLNITEVSRFRITKEGAEDYADLSVYYMNYNAVPYRDQALTINMETHSENYVLINIPAHFYIKANAPYKLVIDKIIPSGGPSVNGDKMVVHDWKDDLLIHSSDGMITGERINFQPFDWVHGENYNGLVTTTGGLYSATIYFKIVSTDPNKYFPDVPFKINLTAGIIQPEANCYIMKTTQKVPILIPLSRINTAADWYKQWEEECNEIAEARTKIGGAAGISKDDYEAYAQDGYAALPRLKEGDKNIEAAVIWSTIRYVTSRGTVKDSGISILKTVVVDGKNYLMVALADDLEEIDEGNAVVGVRRPKTPNEFLWSWHIWVVKEYPWLPLSGYSPGIFMNRNLGARSGGHGLFPGQTNLIYTGLFYQFGRKDPFYADYFTKSGIVGNIPEHKIYLGSPIFKPGFMTEQRPKYGKALLDYNKLYTMKQLIRYPYKIAAHDRNEEYMVETAGPNRGDGYMVGTALWQGEAIYTRHDKLARDRMELRTKKTPFDPSPYGWKVPSVGVLEMGRCFELDPLYFVNNGFFHANGQSLEYVGNNIVHLHTATTDIGSKDNKAVFNNGAFLLKPDGNRWQQEFNISAFYPNAQSSALPVRSVQNERETDFKKYTEEGFYDRAAR